MNKKISTLAGIAVVLATLLTWWFSDTQVLKRRSAETLDCIHLEANTSRVQRAFKAENLKDLIADTVLVSYPEMETDFQHPYATNEPVTLSAEHAKSALLYLSETAEWIEISNPTIELLENKNDTAKLAVTFDISAKLKNSVEHDDKLNAVFTFSKIQSKWKLVEARF